VEIDRIRSYLHFHQEVVKKQIQSKGGWVFNNSTGGFFLPVWDTRQNNTGTIALKR
jgi:hypothetical protein